MNLTRLLTFAASVALAGLMTAGVQAAEPAEAELKALEGDWTIESFTLEGNMLSAEQLRNWRRSVVGNHVIWKNGEQLIAEMDIKIDPAQDPKHLDSTSTSGSSKGQTVLAIYELKDDVLLVCFASPGRARPSEFSSTAGSGQSLYTAKRIKTAVKADVPVLPRLSQKLSAGQPVKIVCLGDSVTGVYYHTGGRRAYPEMLAVALQQVYPNATITAVNAGISGNTTRDALARLEKDVLVHKPDLVTVMFGLNDMVRVPLAEYQANLKEIVERCRGVGAEVMLCTPNAIIDSGGGRTTAGLVDYRAGLKEVGQQLGLPVCDCYAVHVSLRERDPLAWRLVMSDAIHPNMDGHKLNATAICKSITGQEVSLATAAPLQPALPKTLARIKAGEPVRVLAMPPYDEWIASALATIHPEAKVEVTLWPTADQTLAQIEETSKTVRGRALDLVLVAVPGEVTPSETPPPEAAIASYTWVLNWALSFGYQEWDVVGIAPSTLKPALTAEAKNADDFARHLIAAQDLCVIGRAAGDESPPEAILADWLRGQLTPQ